MDSAGACATEMIKQDHCTSPKQHPPPPPRAKPEQDPTDTDDLIPITPDSLRENGDFLIHHLHSPLTQQLKLASIHPAVDPHTPKHAVFDPFAPGPHDNFARAPLPIKHLDDELRISVTRRLDFHDDADSLSDQDMFDSVYQNLLQFIVSKQTEEGVLAQMSSPVEYDSDDCKTPPSPPLHFNGTNSHTDTCPGAPVKVKPGAQPRNILVGLCKKLEF